MREMIDKKLAQHITEWTAGLPLPEDEAPTPYAVTIFVSTPKAVREWTAALLALDPSKGPG